MPSPEAALVAVLKANVGVAALAGTKVFIVGGRQGTEYPYITVHRIVTIGATYLDGANTLEWPLFQIDIYAETALEALNLGAAVRTALDNIANTGAGLTFTATFQNHGGPAPDEETRKFRVIQDYLIFHERN